MRRTWLMVAVTLGLVAHNGARPHACTCIGPSAACSVVWDYPDVFVASVTNVGELHAVSGRLGELRPVTMRVAETLKGTASDVVQVFTGRGDADCGYRFEVGRSYLVYASRQKDTGDLSTGICSRTAPVDAAAADLLYLRGAFRTPSTLGSIEGTVERYLPGPPGRGETRTPFEGATVVLQGVDRRYETRTRSDGHFSFRVPAGQYQISSRVPAGWYSWHDEPRRVELKDPRGCALVPMSVRPDGRIAGRLLDAAGLPVPFMTVEVARAADVVQRSYRAVERTLTAADGTFEVRQLPQGEYVVGLTMTRAARGSDDSVLLHRGDQVAPKTTVDTGQRVQINDVTLPPTASVALLTGTILDAAGMPGAGVKVYVLAPINSVAIHAGPVETDAAGRFKISVIAGRDYRLSAEQVVQVDGGRLIHRADVPRFAAMPGLAPFVLKLR